jgi:trk system potassium uptake protein
MKQFIVLGLGRFGSAVATTLAELGCEVLGVDSDPERVNSLKNKITEAVEANISDEKTLTELGAKNFDVAIVGVGENLESSILTVIILKEMGIKYIIAKAQNALHGRVLEKIGVNKVVFPERDMGIRIARGLITPNIEDYIELEPDYSVIEIRALPDFADKTLSELDLRTKYGINVLAIKRDHNFNISPSAKDVIKSGDFLIVIGDTKAITKLANKPSN